LERSWPNARSANAANASQVQNTLNLAIGKTLGFTVCAIAATYRRFNSWLNVPN
jgi:hypothetical protein